MKEEKEKEEEAQQQQPPRSVIVKTMVVDKSPDKVFNFFSNLKNWETGGALKNIKKINGDDGGGEWWEVENPLGKAKIRLRPNKQFGLLDHDFQQDTGEKWTVFCRITPNGSGSTTSWEFIQPTGMPPHEFENQLKNFDHEIEGWKKAITEA